MNVEVVRVVGLIVGMVSLFSWGAMESLWPSRDWTLKPRIGGKRTRNRVHAPDAVRSGYHNQQGACDPLPTGWESQLV